MKTACRFRWPGSATTIATRTAAWLTRIGPYWPAFDAEDLAPAKRFRRCQSGLFLLPRRKPLTLFFIDSNQPDDTELLVAGVTGSVKK